MIECPKCKYPMDTTEDNVAKYFYCKNCGYSYREEKTILFEPKKDKE